MSDLISRQAAIEALNGEIEITGRTNAEAVKGYVRLVKDRLERLPSAQPEQRIPQMRGWVCPVCGRGLSPYTTVCPCNNGKGWELTC